MYCPVEQFITKRKWNKRSSWKELINEVKIKKRKEEMEERNPK